VLTAKKALREMEVDGLVVHEGGRCQLSDEIEPSLAAAIRYLPLES
jgi:hypothetical protein